MQALLLTLHSGVPGEDRMAMEVAMWYLGIEAGMDLVVAVWPLVCAWASRQLSPPSEQLAKV